MLQTQADVLAAKIAGLSVKINMQKLPNLCALPHVWGPFSETKRKYKIFSKINATLKRAARREIKNKRNRDHVLLHGLEQVQVIY